MRTNYFTTICKTAICCLLSITSFSLFAQTTPYGWRGPERNGIYPEKGLLKEWPTEGPQLLWEVADAGKGYSSPLIVDKTLYITGMNADGTKDT